MRVLHINCNYMGTALHQTMIEHLDQLVDENKVFCPISNHSAIVTHANDNVVVSNCFNRADRFFFYRKQGKILASLEASIDVAQYDIIHAYTLFTDGNAAYQLSKKYRIPFVVAIRATDLQFFKYRVNLRNRGLEILQNAAAVLFLSDTTMEYVLAKYVPNGMRNEIRRKVSVITNGIDDFWIENAYKDRDVSQSLRRLEEKTIRVCCVAQLIRRKNIPLLQKALGELRKAGWKTELTVIGKAVDSKVYEQVTKDPFTVYIPPVNKEKLIDYYRKSDVFVLLSTGETFGLVYAEAMSQGLPVIYTRGEGFDGQFEEGVVGYSVAANDCKGVCEKIQAVAECYADMSQTSLRDVSRFRWEKICGEYRNIYSRLHCSSIKNKED